MMATDEDALVCDFAETYHILDYRALPVQLQAVLASGLREDSRIKTELVGYKHLPAEIVNVQMADTLTAIHFALTSKKGDPAPSLLMDYITSSKEEKNTTGFDTGEEFEAAKKRILMRVNRSG